MPIASLLLSPLKIEVSEGGSLLYIILPALLLRKRLLLWRVHLLVGYLVRKRFVQHGIAHLVQLGKHI